MHAADAQLTVMEVEKLRSLRDELARARTTSRDVRSSVESTQSAIRDLTRRGLAAEADAEKLRNHLAAADEQVIIVSHCCCIDFLHSFFRGLLCIGGACLSTMGLAWACHRIEALCAAVRTNN